VRAAWVVAVLLLVAGLSVWAAGRVRSRRRFATSAERVTFETLHTASLAAPPLRLGLTEASAGKSARHLRTLLGTPAIAISDTEQALAWEGPGDHHAGRLWAAAADGPLASGRPVVVRADELLCADPMCLVRGAVVVPIAVDDRVVGTLAAVTSTEPGPGLVQAALETLMRGRTSVIVAHRLSTVRRADRIYVIKDGAAAESGTHAELMMHPEGVYRTLSELQSDRGAAGQVST